MRHLARLTFIVALAILVGGCGNGATTAPSAPGAALASPGAVSALPTASPAPPCRGRAPHCGFSACTDSRVTCSTTSLLLAASVSAAGARRSTSLNGRRQSRQSHDVGWQRHLEDVDEQRLLVLKVQDGVVDHGR